MRSSGPNLGVAGHVGDTRERLQLKTTVCEHDGSEGGASEDSRSGSLSALAKHGNSSDTKEKLQFRTTSFGIHRHARSSGPNLRVAGHVADTRGKLRLKTTVCKHEESKGGTSEDSRSGNLSTWVKQENSSDARGEAAIQNNRF